MGTKNISLPSDLEAFIDGKVETGEYAHASEVVRDGLRLMMRVEAEKLEWLRAEVAKGVADMGTGRVHAADDVYADITRRLSERT
jgi:antitoxin ParD1/3/4